MDRFQPREGTPAPYSAHMTYIADSVDRAFKSALGDYIALSPDFYISGALITEQPIGSSTSYTISAGHACYKGEVMSVPMHAVVKTASQLVWLEVRDDPADEYPVLNLDGNTDYVLRRRTLRLKVGPVYPNEYMSIGAPRKEALDRLRYKGRLLPTGSIIPYFGDMTLFDATGKGNLGTDMEGWAVCNGVNGTPDLRGRTLIEATNVPSSGAPAVGNDIAGASLVGENVGTDNLQLEADHLPPHNHPYNDNFRQLGGAINPIGLASGGNSMGITAFSGNTQDNVTTQNPVDVRQASFALVFIMSLS